MSYRIELIPHARAEVSALPGYVRAQALDLIAALGQEPRPPRARRLRARPRIYRIWLAGRWRLAYEIDEKARRVLILCLRRKESADYHRLSSWMHESGTDFQADLGLKSQATLVSPFGLEPRKPRL